MNRIRKNSSATLLGRFSHNSFGSRKMALNDSAVGDLILSYIAQVQIVMQKKIV